MKGWIVSAMTVLLATVTAVFADTEVVDGIEWTYTVSDGKVRIDGISYSTAGDITIPSELGGYPVSQIRDYAFRWREGLTSVAIPDSVTSIGNYAFSDCTGLTSVTIPGSVTRTSAVTFDAVSGTTYHIAVGGYDIHSGGIVLSWEPEDEDELIPSVDEDADAEAVAAAIEAVGFADEAAILDAVAGSAASYNAFVAWARDVIGDESAVIMSPYAAISYLLGADELVADDITSENVHIVSFDVSNDATRAYQTIISNAKNPEKVVMSNTWGTQKMTKALNANEFIYTKESFRNSPDVYVSTNFKDEKKISAINPQQKDYLWGNGFGLMVTGYWLGVTSYR